MKKIQRILLVLFFVQFASLGAFAQLNVSSSLTSHDITIGDQTQFIIEVTFEDFPETLVFPNMENTQLPEAIDVLSFKIDTVFSSSRKIEKLRQTLTITAFEEGSFNLDFFQIQYRMPNATVDYNYISQVPPQTLQVKTVAVDTTKAIKDLKTILQEPKSWKEFMKPVLIGLGIWLLAAIIIYIIVRLKKKKPILPFIQEKIPLKPHEEALQNLEILRQKKLWQSGRIKEYHTELTDILRIYLTKRYYFHALEMPTDELLYTLEYKNISPELLPQLKKALNTSNLVKFAKFQPLPDEHDFCFSNIKQFIESTIPQEEPQTEK